MGLTDVMDVESNESNEIKTRASIESLSSRKRSHEGGSSCMHPVFCV